MIDSLGRAVQTNELGLTDEIAAAASMVAGQANEGTPMAIVGGLKRDAQDGRATDLVRPRAIDPFP